MGWNPPLIGRVKNYKVQPNIDYLQQRRKEAILEVVMIVLGIAVAITILLCTAGVSYYKSSKIESLLESKGYWNISAAPVTIYTCSKSQVIHYQFIGTAPGNTAITGSVCCDDNFENCSVVTKQIE